MLDSVDQYFVISPPTKTPRVGPGCCSNYTERY